MNLSWYFNRLRSMGPAEILHRVRERWRKTAIKKRHQGWHRFPSAQARPIWQNLHARVMSASPGQREQIAASADAFLSGRFEALGQTWPEAALAAPYDQLWHLDPVSQTSWPGSETCGFDVRIDYGGGKGDIKYAWEINRLQILPVLAADYCLDGTSSRLSAIEELLASWYAHNPPFSGIAWMSGIEIALRAVNILALLDLVQEKLSPQTREQATRILAASAHWLEHFPSHHSSANNHRVAELAGLYLIALSRDQMTASSAASAELRAELQKQILRDGTGAEQSPTYGAFTAELVLHCAQAARERGEPFPQDTDDRLRAFADFIFVLGTGRFGDDDEGRVVCLGREDDYPITVASAINRYCGGSPVTHEDFRALFFPAADSGPAASPEGLFVYQEGGLSLWRRRLGDHLIGLRFDHGPLGYLSIAAHGHADALSLCLDLDGEPVLIDPGTYLYGSGGSWRSWFRSTPAHNTLNIAGQSQSVMSGPFNWSSKAKARLIERSEEPDWLWVAEHDGYEKRFGVRHRREVGYDSGAIRIVDRLIGRHTDVAEIVWQCAPDIEVELTGNTALCRRAGQVCLAIDLPQGTVSVTQGGPPSGGWASTRFGTKVPAVRIAWRGNVGATGVMTILRPFCR